MSLRTYDGSPIAWPIAAIDRKANEPLPDLQPGMWVEMPGMGGLGMIMAVDDSQVSVLWSTPPPNSRAVAVQKMAQQIRDDVDADILRDLQAAAKHDQ